MLALGDQAHDNNTGEDCLNLNIWVPPTTNSSSASSPKAVMFWIYGGAFRQGTASIYDFSHLAAEQDVLVVSINYRTNFFGFPGSPAAALNAGLLDQRLALEWVRDNIGAFGGDVNRITIFGQSAGAISVDYHAFAWPEDPIAHAFIQESGTVVLTPAISTEGAARNWYNVSAALGCGGAESPAEEVLGCMRKVPVERIIPVVAPMQASTAPGGGSYLGVFTPTADEEVVFGDYPKLLEEGKFADRPLLLGNNDHESGLQRAIIALIAGFSVGTDAYWNSWETVLFECPAAKRAYWSVKNGVETFRYVYYGDFDNIKLTTKPDSGAYHGAEGRSILDDWEGVDEPTEEQKKVGRELRDAFAGFAKDPKGWVRQGEWKRYVLGEETLKRIAWENMAGENYIDPREIDYRCSFYDAIFGDAGATVEFDSVGETVHERLANLTRVDAQRSFTVYGT